MWFCQGTMRMDDGRIIECGWEDLLGGRTYWVGGPTAADTTITSCPGLAVLMSIGVRQTCMLPWTAV